MIFSIQEEGKEKKIFFTFKDAEEATGIPSKHIWRIVKRKNPKYIRRSDKIFFFIQNEDKKDEKMFTIDEEEITSFSQIGSKTRLKPIDFFNQISNKQKHFLDSNGIQHTIDWISPKIDYLFEALRQRDFALKVSKVVKNARKIDYDKLNLYFQDNLWKVLV